MKTRQEPSVEARRLAVALQLATTRLNLTVKGRVPLAAVGDRGEKAWEYLATEIADIYNEEWPTPAETRDEEPAPTH